MQKVDIAIGVIGAVALLATGLGIALYDEINGLTHYHVDTVDVPFDNSGDVPDAGVSWDFPAPENAFHSVMDLTVTFGGANPSLAGNVIVTVQVTGPDGTVETFESDATDFGAGSVAMEISTAGWGTPPGEFSGTEEDVADKTLTWTDPLNVQITIEGPAGQLPIVGQDDPTYTAELTGVFHAYSIAPDTPEPENV